MFNSEENVTYRVENFESIRKNDQVIEGYSVDAYVSNNNEVKAYVEAKRIQVSSGKIFLRKQGRWSQAFEVKTAKDASQKTRNRKIALLCHLDPLFVEIEDVVDTWKRWMLFNSQPKSVLSCYHVL